MMQKRATICQIRNSKDYLLKTDTREAEWTSREDEPFRGLQRAHRWLLTQTSTTAHCCHQSLMGCNPLTMCKNYTDCLLCVFFMCAADAVVFMLLIDQSVVVHGDDLFWLLFSQKCLDLCIYTYRVVQSEGLLVLEMFFFKQQDIFNITEHRNSPG